MDEISEHYQMAVKSAKQGNYLEARNLLLNYRDDEKVSKLLKKINHAILKDAEKFLSPLFIFTTIMLIILIILNAIGLYWTVNRFSLIYGIWEGGYIVVNLVLLFFVLPQVRQAKAWAIITFAIFFFAINFLFSYDFIMLIIQILLFVTYTLTYFWNRKRLL